MLKEILEEMTWKDWVVVVAQCTVTCFVLWVFMVLVLSL